MFRISALSSAATWLAVLLLLFSSASSGVALGVARAEVEPTEPAGYREAIDEAVREFSDRNFEESRALFARAHALLPNARTLRGMGMAEFELRNYGECIVQLTAALASTVRPLNDKLRTDTEQMLARANNFVARVLVDAKPAATQLIVDRLPVSWRAGETLTLEVGEHTIEVHTGGYQPEVRRLSVKGGGDTQTLTVVFSKPVAAAVPAPAPARRWYKSPWLWTAVGVVAAGAVTGTALAVAGGNDEPTTNGGTSGVILRAP